MYQAKFGPGDSVHAKVISLREQKDSNGKDVINAATGKPVMEEFTFREFNGVVDEVHVRREGDEIVEEYRCTHDDLDKHGHYWVNGKFLTA